MALLSMVAALAAQAGMAGNPAPPIIDMHFHASEADSQGPPGAWICAPYLPWPRRDPAEPIEQYVREFAVEPQCPRRFQAPLTDAEIRDRNLEVLRRRNILAVASEPAELVADYRAREPNRIIPAISFGIGALPPIEALRALHAEGRLAVLGELTFQYAGIAPDDPRIEPYYALAEELDVPVAIHVGPGPPGISYFAAPGYRMRHSNPLALEEVLMRHPRMRLYVMHAGWPMADEMIALMYAHPQVYVDTGVLDYAFPRAEFHAYLRRLVDAGFGRRIMFGSDQMLWPDAIEAAIEGIESADFLTPEQKRDILYDNAARFLRLTPAQVAGHHGP